MNLNAIKKALYTQKPKARLKYIRKGTAYYEGRLNEGVCVYFEIPVEDMGDSDFLPLMEVKHLIRWIQL